jgi:hypothetical protein
VTTFRDGRDGRAGRGAHAFALAVLYRHRPRTAWFDPPVSRLTRLPIEMLTGMIAYSNGLIAALAVMAEVGEQVPAVLHFTNRLVC